MQGMVDISGRCLVFPGANLAMETLHEELKGMMWVENTRTELINFGAIVVLEIVVKAFDSFHFRVHDIPFQSIIYVTGLLFHQHIPGSNKVWDLVFTFPLQTLQMVDVEDSG